MTDKIYAKGTKRNFPQVEKKQWYSLAELQDGDWGSTTDTDTKTAWENDEGATSIYKKGK